MPCVLPRFLPVIALAALLSCPAAMAQSHGDAARLAQLVDYVGVDYAAAVRDGAVVNELEYGEMQEFAGLIADEVHALADPEARAALAPLAARLQAAVNHRSDPAEIADLADRMTAILLRSPALAATPATLPDPAAAKPLYAQQCSGCHGIEGHGDGPAVTARMDPPPTDFTDPGRARARSLYGLYNTITLGVSGTAMPSFSQLTEQQRWSLAFLVGAMHVDEATLAAGRQVFRDTPDAALPDPETLTTRTLNGVQHQEGADTAALYAWLRTEPQALPTSPPTEPLALAQAGVKDSLARYAAGNAAAAHDAAVDAYLEGFELAEAALSTTQPTLVHDVERAMTNLRIAIREHRPVAEVRATGQRVLDLLQQARTHQSEATLSPGVAFVSALIIMLREGLEAILVLGAMAAFLNKVGRRDALAWLHAGWVVALAVGVLTWVVSNYFITISGATREVTEGVTALIAAVVLLYVGFWLHSRMHARRWQGYLQQNLERALAGRGLWALAGIAFVAVYREVFETVLFYQALWVQVTLPRAASSTVAGAATGLLAIFGIAWAIFRFGVRLPLKSFFTATAGVMIALAVVFAGKGVAALQEAGKLPLNPVHFPRIDLLGIYPTLQSLGLQFIVLAVALTLIYYSTRSSRVAVAQD